jgi:IclR family mhp operon transcriptional activator
MGTILAEANYRHVRGLVRGLAVLTILNRRVGSTATVAELLDDTKLHRTTVKRLLETLRQAGFVRYDQASNSYSLTFRVRQLSDGFHDEVWISEIGRPLIRELTNRILWPSDLMTLEEDELVVRESTHPFSPLSFSVGAWGQRVPLLPSAVGRAYIAFCPPDEQSILLKMLRARRDEQGTQARNAREIQRIITSTRARGFAVNARIEGKGTSRFGGVAVPIRHEGRVIACLNVVFLMRAISYDLFVEQHLSSLLATRDQIEAGIKQISTRY